MIRNIIMINLMIRITSISIIIIIDIYQLLFKNVPGKVSSLFALVYDKSN